MYIYGGRDFPSLCTHYTLSPHVTRTTYLTKVRFISIELRACATDSNLAIRPGKIPNAAAKTVAHTDNVTKKSEPADSHVVPFCPKRANPMITRYTTNDDM